MSYVQIRFLETHATQHKLRQDVRADLPVRFVTKSQIGNKNFNPGYQTRREVDRYNASILMFCCRLHYSGAYALKGEIARKRYNDREVKVEGRTMEIEAENDNAFNTPCHRHSNHRRGSIATHLIKVTLAKGHATHQTNSTSSPLFTWPSVQRTPD